MSTLDDSLLIEEPQQKIGATALKFGLMTFFAGVIYSIILLVIGQEYNQGLSYVAYLILIVGIASGVSNFRSLNNNRLSGKQGFALGFRIVLIYSVLMAVFLLIYFNLINPEYIDGLMANSVDKMKERGMSQETIDQAMKFSQAFMKPSSILIMGTIMNLLFGAVFSGITALLLKTKKRL